MNRLKDLRKQKNLKQSDVARILNVTPQAYGNYESERREISPEHLKLIADYYGVSVDYILGRNIVNLPEEYKNLEIVFSDLQELTQNQIDEVIKFSKFIKERDKNK